MSNTCMLCRQFNEKHIASLEVVMKLYEAPAAKFPWALKNVKFWMDGGHTPLRARETALSRLKSVRPDSGYLELGKFYLCEPAALPRGDNKPFWLGRLLEHNEETAKVQHEHTDRPTHTQTHTHTHKKTLHKNITQLHTNDRTHTQTAHTRPAHTHRFIGWSSKMT
jgi:hypothetical protein